MKIIIDTNVLISSLWGGNPKKIIDLWKENKLEFVVSDSIMEEYLSVLRRFNITTDRFVEFIELFSNPRHVIRVKPSENFDVIKEDKEDNKFLECAVEGKVNFIVSGDNHLRKLKEFQNIKILSPAQFIVKFGTKL